MGNMERNDLEEEEDVPDEEIVIKMKKRPGVQKMTTRDLVRTAQQASSDQCPGNSTVLVTSIFIHHPKCFYSPKLSFSTGTFLMHPAWRREVVLAMEK